jgi:glycosyltransferase involved in cell wall biosynthesis
VSIRLLYLVSHPIQYQAPLLRRIAADPDIDLLVLFEGVGSVGSHIDAGFNRELAWDIPLTDGYESVDLSTGSAVQEHIEDADVLWVHGWDSSIKRHALAEASKSGVPVLMRGENTNAAMPDGGLLRGLFKRAYLRRIFRHCAGFLCIGSDNRQYYKDRGIEDDQLFSMPYAVDNDFFQGRAEAASQGQQQLRSELGLENDRPVILYAGKLQARKHPLTLLAAFREMDMTAAGHPYLIYIGDGDQKDVLIDQAREMGDRVKILGFKNQTELPAYYDLADVFVLASEKEPWGLAVNEAMNAETAIIVSDECGCAADLISPDCGTVIRPNDVVNLRQSLTNMLSGPQKLETMGKQAKQAISNWGLEQSHQGLKQALIRLGFGPT